MQAGCQGRSQASGVQVAIGIPESPPSLCSLIAIRIGSPAGRTVLLARQCRQLHTATSPPGGMGVSMALAGASPPGFTSRPLRARSTATPLAHGRLAAPHQQLALPSSSSNSIRISGRTGAEGRQHPKRRQRPVAGAAAADADAGLAAQAAATAAAAGVEAERQMQQMTQQDAAAAVAAQPAAVEASDEAAPAPKKKGGLAKRVVFGVILGLSGAAVIIVGGWLYCFVACLAAYQLSQVKAWAAPAALMTDEISALRCTCHPCALHPIPPPLPCCHCNPSLQEFIGLVGAKGISKGMRPPPPLVNNAISLLCVALNAWVFITNGRAASAMAVATFMCLCLQLLAVRKPRFAQLASSVFGLFYCGAQCCRLE